MSKAKTKAAEVAEEPRIYETRDLVEREREKLLEMLAAVDADRLRMVDKVIDNVAWMSVKLDQTRTILMNAQVVIGYDNGGGQKGIRKNPTFEAYGSLFTKYLQGIKQLCELLPDHSAADELKAWAESRR